MNEKAYIVRNLRGAERYRNLLKVSQYKTPSTLDSVAAACVADINANSIWNGKIKIA